MAVYRNINLSFWTNLKVIMNMNHKEKLFFIYLLTNNCTTQIGIYEITKKQIGFELDLSINAVTRLLKKFEEEFNVIKYNEKTHEIAIKNWGKYNCNKGGKPMIDCINKELKMVKELELLKFVSEKIERKERKELFDNAYNEKTLKKLPNDTYTDTSKFKLTIGTQREKEEEKQKEKNVIGKYAKLYTENIGVINGVVSQWLIEIADTIDIDLFKRAIEIATDKGKCNKGYVQGIINQWLKNNIKTFEELKEYELKEKHNISSNIRQIRGIGKTQPINFLEESEVLYSKPSEEDLRKARELSQIL